MRRAGACSAVVEGPPDPVSVTAVVSRFPAPSEVFIRRKLEALQGAGCSVTVASPSFGSDAEAAGFDLVDLAPWHHPRRLASRWGRRSWRSSLDGMRAVGGPPTPSHLRRLPTASIRGLDSDIVHFEFSGVAVAYRDHLDALRPSRIVVSCRGAAEQIVPLRDPRRADQLRDVFQRVDLIHCVSSDLQRTAIALGAPPDLTFVNRPAVPVARFAPLADRRPRAEGPLRVLSIGRLHWKKGLDDGLRAVAAAQRSGLDARYRIVGEGPEREKLTFMIDQLGLDTSVSLVGTQTPDEVLDHLAWADVLLLPSLSEGISNVVLEAMASGLAVVTTECGGMREVVTDGTDGCIVAVGDVEAMAQSLLELGADPALRATYGGAAAKRARAEFDLSRQCMVFLDAYRSVLERPARTGR